MNDTPGAGEVTRRRMVTPRPESVQCGWCGQPVVVPPRGRVPSWCGSSCRHRAWEQTRAAASGLAAKEIVERVVERTVTLTVRVPAPGPVPSPPRPVARSVAAPTRVDDWARLLAELARQIDAGRIYDRDLPAVAAALDAVAQASSRRRHHTGHRRRH